MRSALALLALVALVTAETYNTEHDNLDVQALVSDIEALRSFLDCFIDKQPCNDVQQSFKEDLAEAVAQACAKCTTPQKKIARSFLAAVQEKIPDGYVEFKNKYDPEDKYFTKLEESLANV